MANRKTIAQLERELDRYFRQLRHITRQIDERRELIKKIRLGKVKQPAPKGKMIYLKGAKEDLEYLKSLDDPLPSFGKGPAVEG